MKYAYKENVEFVLGHVSDVVPDLRGSVVITANRGVSMSGTIGYPVRGEEYVRRTVPWLEVTSINDPASPITRDRGAT